MTHAAPARSRASHDVAIVGYGPVGAFTALLMAEAGLRVLVIDRTHDVLPLPRAVGLDGESMRAFQRMGIADDVVAVVQPPRDVDRISFTNSKREEIIGMSMTSDGVNGWRDIYFFDQPEFESVLRRHVDAHEGIDTLLGSECERVERLEDQVVLHGKDIASGDDWQKQAAYVIGCDGASSLVRRELGAEWLSLGYDQDWLVIDIVQTTETELPLMTMQVCDPSRLTSYICVKDPYRRWEFQLNDSDPRSEMTAPERIHELLGPWLPPEQYEIRRAAVYQFHAAVASQWQAGRVLIAGDAAHQTPPFLGQGLNAGLRDAVNLGWKLPLVLAGTCGPEMLESYAEERAPHSHDLVEAAVHVGMLMETFAASEAGLPDPHANAAPTRMRYAEGRIAPPLRAGVLNPSQLGPTSPIGELFVQPTVRTSDGREQRLDDLCGPGFSVIARTQDDLSFSSRTNEILQRLGATCIALEGLEAVAGEFDPILDTHPAVLVRPDGYIYGAVDDAHDLDALVAELGRQLSLHA